MAGSNKRKERTGNDNDARGAKRSKGGTGGKWQTPHQREKAGSRGSGKIEFGDAGIWVTCAKNQERRATEELKTMFEECAERFYGIKPGPEGAEDDEDDAEDIESAIQKEIASLSNMNSSLRTFSPVPIDLPCVIFFKTRPPIDPVDFVSRICNEIVSTPGIRRMRYVNRLTPVTTTGRATEKGLEELGKALLSKHFTLKGEEENSDEDSPAPSYAIRPTIRAHSALKRLPVITQVAESIGSNHKVNLTTPDKVIIIEIYQTMCGMSVVGEEWETLKRFNLAELYRPAQKPAEETSVKATPNPEEVKTDDAQPAEDTQTQGTGVVVP